jgi:hypothetical protein
MGLNAFARHDNVKAEELRKAIALTGDDNARNNYQIRRLLRAGTHLLPDRPQRRGL